MLHSIWQLAIVVILVAILLRLLRSSTPNVRYVVAVGGLLAMYLLLAVTWGSAQRPAVNVDQIPLETPLINDLAVAQNLSADVARDASPTHESSKDVGWIEGVGTALQKRMGWIVGPGLTGVSLLSLWNLGGWVVLVRLRHRGTRLSPAFNERVQRLASRMRVSRGLRPLANGWLKRSPAPSFGDSSFFAPAVDVSRRLRICSLPFVRNQEIRAGASMELVRAGHPSVH